MTVILLFLAGFMLSNTPAGAQQPSNRQHIPINAGWRFMRYSGEPDSLFYDERPRVADRNDNKVADTRASESAATITSKRALKNWILPSANDFIKDPSKRHRRPPGDPGSSFPFVRNDFDDRSWQPVDLPHDWAINGPFYTEEQAIVGGGMGRLPVQGVAWYRKKLDIPVSDTGRCIYLDIDGAMSYAMVWLNGKLVGGWPYGYNSFRLDLTRYVKPGGDNQLAIRLDNPANSSRWYPGAGLYRNVWLEIVNPVHVAQWGTFIKTKNITTAAATVDLSVLLDNASASEQKITVVTEIVALNDKTETIGKKVADLPPMTITLKAGEKQPVEAAVTIKDPLLWGPPPFQRPNRYMAVTKVYAHGKQVDEYKTRFGIRSVEFDPVKGVIVNGRPVRIQGVNQHHDLGALGAAFNTRAAERQLELLRDMGCNAIRLAHNPPAPELLDLTDRMGFLVIDEIFDCWYKGKTPLDFHLIFPDWHEPDLRSFIRRDRNHPSVIEWSFGNEVGEQYTGQEGAAIAKELHDIVKDEDSTRPATASMNYAKPDMPFPAVMDVISLNYQGEGIRDAPAYAHLRGIATPPLYPAFQQRFPHKLIQSTETASTLSTRGAYIFPVTGDISAPVSDSMGGDATNKYVSAYDLYTAAFGASPDKVFYAQDHNPFVAGEFVWSGWDYLGEPTPYYLARSSYSGIIDLAGFPKDRFYLYQSRWRPDLPMAHILPHWTWPGRVGKITPVHVYTSGDEAELFLNNHSLGRKKKTAFEYRLRWDSVTYEPGELKAVAYKNGRPWATDVVRTAGAAAKLQLSADRNVLSANGTDLSFITVRVLDGKGVPVPEADEKISFELSGPGEIVATDNGNPADMTPFPSKDRAAFNGLALAIVRSKTHRTGSILLTATTNGLPPASIIITSAQEQIPPKKHSDNEDGTYTNPVIPADFPDPDVIRVGDTYYMVTTTMFVFPGVPILRSHDLVNWEYCSNALPRFDFSKCYDLDSCNRYGHGQWATSIKYHNGQFYLLFITLNEGGFMCTAPNAEGPWKVTHLPKGFYDPGLFFDDNGRTYVAQGYNKMSITEVDSTLTPIGPDSLVYTGDIRKGLEGTHVYKINGYYYLYSTYGGVDGIQVALRSKNIYGPYEQKVVLRDTTPGVTFGVHQGALIQTPAGEWWTMLFVDSGPFGRFPSLQPVTWTDGWPMAGIGGKGVVTYRKPDADRSYPIKDIPTSDEFDQKELGMQWGWNHNPDPTKWSLTKKKGWLRLMTVKVVSNLTQARNTLTQRPFTKYDQTIPTIAATKMDIAHMRDGDIAGLAVFQDPYAYIGIRKTDGAEYLIMVNNGIVVDSVPVNTSTVYLRTVASNATRIARFEYSLDNKRFIPLGNELSMKFNLKIFTGNKFCLFNYAIKKTGGYVDIDWFRTE
ncbi:MAG TPA: beta-galactosidase GalB [Puia sp.]